jgi:hypothetical protein
MGGGEERGVTWCSVMFTKIYISNQLDVNFSKFFFYFIFATMHVLGVPCPSSGVSLLHW